MLHFFKKNSGSGGTAMFLCKLIQLMHRLYKGSYAVAIFEIQIFFSQKRVQVKSRSICFSHIKSTLMCAAFRNIRDTSPSVHQSADT